VAEERSLFDKGEWWEDEWQGMPEFVQKDLTPFKTLYVHFEKKEDIDSFAKLIGQRVTVETKYVWFPEAEIGHFADRKYVSDES
jgi:hypothetical protein